jgi:prevent-host-death family protein
MSTVGIRELRQEASRHVAAAAAGAAVTVTDRGVPVAKLVPLSPLEHHLAQMLARHGIRPPARHVDASSVTRLTGPSLTAENWIRGPNATHGDFLDTSALAKLVVEEAESVTSRVAGAPRHASRHEHPDSGRVASGRSTAG